MADFILAGSNMQDKESMHAELRRVFPLPAHYGSNLDALWDALTESGEAYNIIIENPECMPPALFSKLSALFLALCRANAQSRFTFRSPALRPGLYRHFKGGLYRLLGTAFHSETMELMAVYQPQTGESLWVRPAAMWCGLVEREGESVPRFARICD